MALKVDGMSDAVSAMRPDLDKIEALMGGTNAMRKAGTTYLKKWPMEDQDSYDFRLQTSTLYNAFARTVENMAAKPFTEEVKWTGIDTEVEAWFGNIDLQRRSLHMFAQDVFLYGLRDGLTHVLIDHQPTRDENGNLLYKTKADEIKAGLRPYAIHIKQSQILGWLSSCIDGVEKLTQLRIKESVTEPDGEFGTTIVEQIRVYMPGAWQTYRKNSEELWMPYKNGTTSLDFIPLVTYYTRRTGFMTATPPLNNLADLNIKHWNSESDQFSLLHTARVPILAIIGVDEQESGKLKIGAKTALTLPVGGDAKYVEHSGKAIEAGRNSLKDLEQQMEAMGAELVTASVVASTATENVLDSAKSQCQLSAMAQGLEIFLDQMVDIMAAWRGLGEQGDIDVFDDFATITVNSATAGAFVTALVLLVDSQLMSRETAFEELKRAGIANPDLVWAVEQKKIKENAPVPVTTDVKVT
jgi:hypothetical protein